MIDEKFVLLAFALNLAGSITYIRGILEGRVKPNKVTWLLWGIIPLIAFSAQISSGVGWPALLTFSAGFFPLLIFLLSFKDKKSEWKISNIDITCGSISIIGIILWLITADALLAILFSIIADAFAGIPTILKSFYNPETEDYHSFLFPAFAAIITLLTLNDWSFAYSAFPLYILGLTSLIAFLMKSKLGKLLSR